MIIAFESLFSLEESKVMSSSHSRTPLSGLQRTSLVLFSIVLAVVLFLFRFGINSPAPLDELARRSIDPETALANGRPTVFEFYADWCEACREMAPDILSIEEKNNHQIDFVLLNVDNESWDDLLKKYRVNGIPKLIFFNEEGELLGSSLGVRGKEELDGLIHSLLKNQPIPSLADMRKISDLRDVN